MRKLIFLSLAFVSMAMAGTGQFVVDDDGYVEKVTESCKRLLHQGKLRSQEALRAQVHTHGNALALAPISHQTLSAPDICDRLRESTLAVGSYYKCPDCGGWHFNSSAGFVIGTNGVICTCCHVLTGEDEGVKESYLVVADSTGHVYPVQSVLASDTEADTCFLKIDTTSLKPLPLRTGVRTGERVYCLSHPAGYFYMFTDGMVARLNLRQNEVYDDRGKTNGLLTRPILFLNVTAEFAPGSSGAPVVDAAGNVVAQVASIAEAGEPPENAETNAPVSPSVPIRFCTATDEILKLTQVPLVHAQQPKVRKVRSWDRKEDAVEKH